MTKDSAASAERSVAQHERMVRKYNRARFSNIFGTDALQAISQPSNPSFQDLGTKT